MIFLVLTACMAGQECGAEDIAMFTSSGDQREFCEVAKKAFEAEYLPRLKPDDRASFRCKGLGEK
jgi:hypothetical protein